MLIWMYLFLVLIMLGLNLYYIVEIEKIFTFNESQRLRYLPTQAQLYQNSILQALQSESKWEYPPIDAVYTWVNGSDPKWLEQKESYFNTFVENLTGESVIPSNQTANGDHRYQDHNELRYSLRSIVSYANWIRNIYLVVATEDQIPNWVNISHPRLRIVTHREIFPEASHLPVFNSRAIESHLNNIDGLSDDFLYLNDDFFFGKETTPADFLQSKITGQPVIYFERWSPSKHCAPKCSVRSLGNSECDIACNVSSCGWDVGDCGAQVVRDGKAKLRAEKRTYGINDGNFIAAMRHVDGVYYREFGRPRWISRKVIRHIPYLLNRRLIADMKQLFAFEFNATSSHRFRHPEDMQFSFSYFHYVDTVRVYAPTEQQIWQAAFDTVDSSLVFLYGKPRKTIHRVEQLRFDRIVASESYQVLQNCTQTLVQRKADQILPAMYLKECQEAVDMLRNTLHLRLPFRSRRKRPKIDHKFILVDGKEKSINDLKNLSSNPAKFIAINDDSTMRSIETDAAYEYFYRTFSRPSEFELI